MALSSLRTDLGPMIFPHTQAQLAAAMGDGTQPPAASNPTMVPSLSNLLQRIAPSLAVNPSAFAPTQAGTPSMAYGNAFAGPLSTIVGALRNTQPVAQSPVAAQPGGSSGIAWQPTPTNTGDPGFTAPDPMHPGMYLYRGPDGVVYRDPYPGEVHATDLANKVGTLDQINQQYGGAAPAPTQVAPSAPTGSQGNAYQQALQGELGSPATATLTAPSVAVRPATGSTGPGTITPHPLQLLPNGGGVLDMGTGKVTGAQPPSGASSPTSPMPSALQSIMAGLNATGGAGTGQPGYLQNFGSLASVVAPTVSAPANQNVSQVGAPPTPDEYTREVVKSLQPEFQQQQDDLLSNMASRGILQSGAASNNLQRLVGQQGASIAGAVAPLIQQGFGQQFSANSQNAAANNSASQQQYAAALQAALANAGFSQAAQGQNAGTWNNALSANQNAYNQFLSQFKGFQNANYQQGLQALLNQLSQGQAQNAGLLAAGMGNANDANLFTQQLLNPSLANVGAGSALPNGSNPISQYNLGQINQGVTDYSNSPDWQNQTNQAISDNIGPGSYQYLPLDSSSGGGGGSSSFGVS